MTRQTCAKSLTEVRTQKGVKCLSYTEIGSIKGGSAETIITEDLDTM